MDSSTDQPKRSLVGFWSLFLTQFQGAFNDNAFKFIVIFMAVSYTHLTLPTIYSV